MATFDMTLGSTISTEAADSIAVLPEARRHAYMVEAVLDISKLPSPQAMTLLMAVTFPLQDILPQAVTAVLT